MVEGDMAGRRACAGRDARLGLYPVVSVTIYTAIFGKTWPHDHTWIFRLVAQLDRRRTNKIRLQNASMG